MSPPALNSVPLHFLSFISSETYTIVAESGQKHFSVHSGVLAARPELLSRVQEEPTKKIDLSDWDGGTVGRLIEFLYIGNYRPPESAPEENDVEEKTWAKERKTGAQAEVNNLGTVQENLWTGSWDAGVNVLLVHLKVYVLAQCTGVKALQQMALERLKVGLEGVDGRISKETPKVAEDVVELLRYVYSRVGPQADSLTDSGKPIRELLSNFVANNFGKLIDNEDMGPLISEGGNLTSDVMGKVAKRLCNARGPCATPGLREKLSNMERELQVWKDRAAASDEKVRQLEATNSEHMEKVRQLEATLELWGRTGDDDDDDD